MGCWSSKQKSLSISLCSGQTSPETAVGFLFLKDSQSALNAKLLVSSSWEHSFQQTGHCSTSWYLHLTGSVKISQQMRYVKSSTRKDRASAMMLSNPLPIQVLTGIVQNQLLCLKANKLYFALLLEILWNLLYLSPHPNLSFQTVNFSFSKRFS